MKNMPRPGTMRSIVRLSLLLVLTALNAPAGARENVDRSVAGRWQLMSVLAYADIAALDEASAKQLVGKVLTVATDQLSLSGTTCGKSSFRVERVRRSHELQENAHVRGTTLGLPDPVEVVELNCAYLYVRTRQRAVLAWDGVYFDVVRLQR